MDTLDFQSLVELDFQIKLPDNPTPTQFKKAEPILLKSIIETFFIEGVKPLKEGEYNADATGSYKGSFRSKLTNKQFKFELNNKGNTPTLKYEPV